MIEYKDMRKLIRKYFLLVFVFFLILVGALIGLFYGGEVSYKTPDSIAKSQAKILIEKVGRLVFLPGDETPTIATVSDPAALDNQEFFAEAKKGDQVLIYTNARKAILYDPAANKIVNMATLNIGDNAPALPNFQGNQLKILNSAGENQF